MTLDKPKTIPTFPARPINCGRLDKALPKHDDAWWCEPKISGMRIVLHVPTGAMWTRLGTPLTNPGWFKKAADKMRAALPNVEWLDAEGLYLAHQVGKGCLIALDIIERGTTIEQRMKKLSALEELPLSNDLPKDEVFRTRRYDWKEAKTVWDTLLGLSRSWDRRANGNNYLYEGIVAKKKSSPYPFQLKGPAIESSLWTKHRFDK